MRRIIFAAVALAAATAFAIQTGTHPIRIALLAAPRDADRFRDHLKDELQRLGYDVAECDATIRDLGPDRIVRADYYVEVLGAGGDVRPVAGIGAGPIDVAVSVSRVAASVNIYDGRTLDLFDAIDLHKRSTAVAPAAIAIGGRSFWAVFGLPFEWAQYRSAMRDLARTAARDIDKALPH